MHLLPHHALRPLILLLGLLPCSAPSLAQQPSQAQANAIRQSCRADYQANCASVPTGGSAALACLQQHASSLSAPCRQAVAAVGGSSGTGAAPSQAAPPAAAARPAPPMSPREQLAVLRGSCGPEYRRYCRGVPLGEGRAIACLRGNADRLSQQCRSALTSVRSSR